MTDEEIREAARAAFHAIVDEAGDNWMGYSDQPDAFMDGFAEGYKAAEARR